MKTPAERKAYYAKWRRLHPDRVSLHNRRQREAQIKQSLPEYLDSRSEACRKYRNRKKVKEIQMRQSICNTPNAITRRFELWRKYKAGILTPEIALKVSKDYAQDFQRFEQQCKCDITANGRCVNCQKEIPTICKN